jgi:hypothetical protein
MPPVFPDTPRWLLACGTCAELLARYRAGAGDRDRDRAGPLRAESDLAGHLVAAHFAELPDYAPGCPTCTEWQAGAEHASAATLALADSDLRHRAAHLFAPTTTAS